MKNRKINIFDNPQYYRNCILNQKNLIKYNVNEFSGKALICVFFTAYCGVGCPFCFFNSPTPKNNKDSLVSKEYHFSQEGVQKFIDFANKSNVGYLQISGGGEPFLEKNAILECVEKVNAERIILVTSGSWAYSMENAEKYLSDLYLSFRKNKNMPRVTIRVSISSYHSIKLKEKPLVNLIKIFEKKYKNEKNFTLQFKIFEDDETLEKYLNENFSNYKLTLIEDNGSDDDNIIKVIPWKYKLTFSSDYEVIVGKSRVFNSNLKPNLYDKESILLGEKIYDTDLELSQNNNSSIVYNSDGTKGLDWIVEYNGNVCTWQNRIQDNLLNIYEDNYDTVLNNTFNDLITFSYIDKGSKYRDSIINEISKRTVLLMKSVNIRDYAGPLLFTDEKIRLYYNIRVLQDYIKENKINLDLLKEFPEELISAINMDKVDLINEYKNSNYSIFEQELKKPVSISEFHDLLELIKLGHYEINKDKIQKALNYYNNISGEQVNSINDIVVNNEMDVERRLTKRLMERKKIKSEEREIYFYLCRHGETNWNVAKRIKGQLSDIKTTFTKKGIKQIEDLFKFLSNKNIDAIFTSDLLRAKETTNLINKNLKLPVYFSKNFEGLNMGNFQGKLMEEFLNDKNVKRAFIDYDFVIPGGESINQLNKRYINGLEIISQRFLFKNVAIISHGAAISNIKSKISGEKYEDIDYCVIKYYNKKYKVIDYGRYK